MDNQLSDFLWSLAVRLPVFIITVAGIAWALANWRKASTAALFTTLACTALLLSSCIFPALLSWLTPMMMRNAPPGEQLNQMRLTNRTILGAWNLCTAVCLGALIFAVFAGRAAQARREEDARLRRRDDDEESEARPLPKADDARDADDRFKAP